MFSSSTNDLLKNSTTKPDIAEIADFESVVTQLLQFHKGLQLRSADAVVAYFNQHPAESDRANFLQNEIYSNGVYCETTLHDGTHAGFRALGEGLELWVGGQAYPSSEGRSVLSWSAVTSLTAALIENGKYASYGLFPSTEKPQDTNKGVKTSSETLQKDIDAVLVAGSGFTHGKYRIYEQFLKKQGAKENIDFLKNEYGSGGGTFFFPDGSRGSQRHDSKGISFIKREPDGSKEVLNWSQINKRLGELIAEDRYLSAAEKAEYPAYQEEVRIRAERTVICKNFMSIIRDYNDLRREQNNYNAMVNQYVLIDCAAVFAEGRKKTAALRAGGHYILPLMRGALNDIIAADVGFNERCTAVLRDLDAPIAKELEPTAEELDREMRTVEKHCYSVGDKVWIDAGEFEIVSLSDNEVCVSDISFPLFTQAISRESFNEKLKENPHNNYLLQVVELPAEEKVLIAEEKATEDNKSSVWEKYSRIMSDNPGTVVLYQVGDFYEVMGDYAEKVANILDIHVTTRKDRSGEGVALCGFPAKSLEKNLSLLSAQGLKPFVASAEQRPSLDALIKNANAQVVETDNTTPPDKSDRLL